MASCGAIAADSLVIDVGGIGYRVFASPAVLSTAQAGGRLKLYTYHLVREDQQALYGFRTSDELGFFELLLTVTGVGPKVALAIVGSRPVAGPPAGDHRAGPGDARQHPRDRQEARRADHLRAQGEGRRGRRRRPVGRRRGRSGEGEVVAALQALGYSLAEARDASRAALAEPGRSTASLEERVKAALRTLLRE